MKEPMKFPGVSKYLRIEGMRVKKKGRRDEPRKRF